MALSTIRTEPALEQYTSLDEHQAQTPGTFFGGKPVLHYHGSDASLCLDMEQLNSIPELSPLKLSTPAQAPPAANGEGDGMKALINVDIWASSEYIRLHETYFLRCLMIFVGHSSSTPQRRKPASRYRTGASPCTPSKAAVFTCSFP